MLKSSNLNNEKLVWPNGPESQTPVDTQFDRSLLDQTQDAIIICDLEERIAFWNKGAERLYGWQASEAIGQNVYALLAHKRLTESEEPDGTFVGDMRHSTKDQTEIIVESRRKFIRDETGRPKSVLIVNTDVTEKRWLEIQFLRAQRMETIDRLVGGIAHDLNNVLSPVLFASSVLEQKCVDPDTKQLLKTLRVNAEHAGRLITHLLSFAKGIDEERTSLDLGCLIKETVEVFSSVFTESIKIKTVIPTELWTVRCNATQLHQVLMNLCLNARDAMVNGGTLTVQAENAALDEIAASKLPGAKPGNYVQITVSDNGVGIPAEIINRIFDAFFTTKGEHMGTGLGLCTVLRIVKAHQGLINVSSEPGNGARFTVFLPAEEPAVSGEADVESLELPAVLSYRRKLAFYAEHRKGPIPLRAKRQSAGGQAGPPLKG